MKTRRASQTHRGFTLIELLVAMTITTIIVGVLVSVTSIAIDTWNRSRSELRASRQAKAMVDALAQDLESLVVRRGNENEWLSVKKMDAAGESTSGAKVVFFTAATDRYNGELNGPDEIADTADDPAGGDISCVGYELKWKDPISGGAVENQTFVLNRFIANPDQTFEKLLGKTEIGDLFFIEYGAQVSESSNFVCENVFQFSVVFHVEIASATGVTTRQVNIGSMDGDVESFSIMGSGNAMDPEPLPTDDDYKLLSGRVTGIGVSLTVLSDGGVDQLRKKGTLAQNAAWLAKNSYQFSKLILVPKL